MSYATEPMLKSKDGKMWTCVRHTMHGIIVETLVGGEFVRGLVDHNDARAYADGHMDSVRIYGVVQRGGPA